MIAFAPFRPRVPTLRSLQRIPITQTTNFSLTSPISQKRMTQDPRRSKAQQDEASGPNPSYPAFSLESLGLSKRTRIVVLVVLSIFGTIETWFWCKAIWQWRKGHREGEK
ncbi:uncharacterized protein BKA55DRAFT_579452 [Fusarium redolens]|uniref:Uncharacterized protein n=1 Tax=Fusarium redolens TaxID=48865 RepID=A0A9P9G9F2_FUSRE|nr:uncharacterized protein BKA55DRAFT_579452 [Fusarium redolens]KAH7234786.1 hypothetical protein BKA55DRAFT_579452 [Fusarium redolens]